MSVRPPTELQDKLLTYLRSVAAGDTARVTQEELAAATGHHRAVIIRALATMVRRGDIEVTPIRATFIKICGGAS